MSDLMKEIGERIKHYRKAKGMTQKELGEKVGCHEGTIRQYENGLREPRKVSKLAIARALDVSYDRLFSQKDGTNLAEVGTDCISRQAAISAICNACGKIDCDKMDKCEKLQLPPANCSEFPNNSDTISRKWLMECVDEGWIKFDTEKDKNIYVHLVRDIAPSAQPERTCVNCGRTLNNGGWYADGRTRCPIEEHYALPKDGCCHLWEKRNVTDDDYPERREE